jgi:cytochrome c oxidase assembly protein subunit 15
MYPKLVLITCVLAFIAVVFSAYARLSDAGLGCTNWPACYEENALKQRQPPKADISRDHTAWQWKLQNLVGALLGILAIAICGHAWQKRKEMLQSPLLPTLLLVLMAFLAVFGILAFSYLPRAVIVMVHLAGGITTLMLLTWISLRLEEPGEIDVSELRGLPAFSRFGLVLVIVEVMLGGWVSSNFAALACNGFPLCQGALIPDMDFSYSLDNSGLPLSWERLTAIHWMHRAGALFTLCYLIWLSFRVMAVNKLNKIGRFMLALVIFQFALGTFNLLLDFPLTGAAMHNAVGMLLLVTLVTLSFRTQALK